MISRTQVLALDPAASQSGRSTDATDSAEQPCLGRIREQRRQWERRALLRAVYRDCFRRIQAQLARDRSGSTGWSLELGCGGGYFKEVCPEVVATDVLPTPWAERVMDAAAIPAGAGRVRNLVLFDVLHHLPALPSFFDEAQRVLETGGRVVIVDPYISPFSRVVYGRFHHEPIDVAGDPFSAEPLVGSDPMDGNQGIARALFFNREGLARFGARWPALRVVKRTRLSLLVYALSGGFSGPILLPLLAGKGLLAVERVLEPLLGAALAFRCLVVIEKRSPPGD